MERLRTNIVPPDGPLDAKILLIGQAPGAEEDRFLRPFVGVSGQLLDRCLRAVGLARGEILINNVFVQRPPRNDVGYFFQNKGNTKLTPEGMEHVENLRRWLEGLKRTRDATGKGPNVIGALGREAMMVLTGKKRISKWRGSVLPCTLVEGFKVYPAYHPSHVLRLMNEPEERVFGGKKTLKENALPTFLFDLDRIASQSQFPEIREMKRKMVLPSGDVSDVIRYLRDARKYPVVAVDIETLQTETGPIVWCVGFAPKVDYAFCIPFLKNKKLCWSLEEEAIIWGEISKLFLDPNVKKVFHNCLYDLAVLGKNYGLRCATGTVEDTMVAHQMTFPYLKKGLDFCASIYTWQPYYKDDGKVWQGKRISDYSEFVYNMTDCCVTREIFPVIMQQARENNTLRNYQTSMKVLPSLLAMQIRGIKIDLERKEKLGETFSKKAEELERNFRALLGDPKINLNSSPQIIEVLYSRLGLPIQYNHKTKRPSADKDAINRLLKKTKKGSKEHELLACLSSYREVAKLSQTYTTMSIDRDGRVRTSYGWVSTFRLSSSESPFGSGGNLQNIPVRTKEGKEIRKLFVPDKGKILIACDLAQAEARVVAWLSRDPKLMKAFREGWDVHWENAKTIFKIPDEVKYVPKAKFMSPIIGDDHDLYFYRRLAKTVVHASNYGMGPRMLQNILIREGVSLPEATCKRLLSSYKENNPMLTQWHRRISEELRATRTLVTPLGDLRTFRGRFNDNLLRSAIAYIPQSTVGRILQLAIEEIFEDLSFVEILLNVHDEVISQIREKDLPLAIKEIRKRMERPLLIEGETLIIPCDFKVGPTWGDLEEIDE